MQPIVVIGGVSTLLGYEVNNINNKTKQFDGKRLQLGADSTWAVIVDFISKQCAYTSYHDYWLHWQLKIAGYNNQFVNKKMLCTRPNFVNLECLKVTSRLNNIITRSFQKLRRLKP